MDLVIEKKENCLILAR